MVMRSFLRKTGEVILLTRENVSTSSSPCWRKREMEKSIFHCNWIEKKLQEKQIGTVCWPLEINFSAIFRCTVQVVLNGNSTASPGTSASARLGSGRKYSNIWATEGIKAYTPAVLLLSFTCLAAEDTLINCPWNNLLRAFMTRCRQTITQAH